MERLTVKWADKVYDTFDPVDVVDNEYSKANYNKILTKLGEYEDLEEQGRLIKLPCKVGDTVYCIFSRYTKCTFNNEEFDEYSCQGCEYECDSKKENYVQGMRAYSLDWIVTNLKKFGKTVFLTESEAEAKLKVGNCETRDARSQT